jgi:hypothetical protein
MNISAVICSRNDNPANHSRIISALNNFTNLYEEVVYVDYGSKDLPLHEDIKDSLNKTGKLKCITLTPDEVKEINPAKDDRFIEVFARNIGIRRAKQDFIVSTNQDIIADKPCIELDKNTMYVAPRRNVPINAVNRLVTSEIILTHLRRFKLAFELRPDSIDSAGNPTHDSGDIWSLVVGCGDYQIAHRNLWEKIRGFEEAMIFRTYADSNLMKKASVIGSISKLDLDVFHLDHPVNSSNAFKNNDRIHYVNNFTSTINPESWGFINNKYKEEII